MNTMSKTLLVVLLFAGTAEAGVSRWTRTYVRETYGVELTASQRADIKTIDILYAKQRTEAETALLVSLLDSDSGEVYRTLEMFCSSLEQTYSEGIIKDRPATDTVTECVKWLDDAVK